MVNLLNTVATSNATAEVAYYICIISFFIAGGVAIYLLWDKVQESKVAAAPKKRTGAKKAVAKPVAKKTTAKKASIKKADVKKPVAKKAVAKKPAAKKAVKKTK